MEGMSNTHVIFEIQSLRWKDLESWQHAIRFIMHICIYVNSINNLIKFVRPPARAHTFVFFNRRKDLTQLNLKG